MHNHDREYWRHRKTGDLYRILDDDVTRESDLEPVVVYQDVASGRKWCRPAVEFFDGRFECIMMED